MRGNSFSRLNSRLRRHKRGALEVSINAIIILIFAIAILGLGLTFIRNMFGKTTEEFGKVTDELKAELKNELKNSNEKLTIKPEEVSVDKSKKEAYVYYGIRNIEDERKTFKIGEDGKISCENIEPTMGTAGLSVTTFSKLPVASGESEVQSARIKITAATPESSYRCAIKVTREGSTDTYAEKFFFIEVTSK